MNMKFLKIPPFVMLLTFLVASPAMALDLQQARSQGIIAEQPNGYITVVKDSPEARSLVHEVNYARQQEYQRISEQNGQPIDVVAAIAAQQIAEKTKSGR
jgi:uncharacterized protein YdbL (DUF1318 family)